MRQKEILLILYRSVQTIKTFVNCVRSGLSFDSSWNVIGRSFVIRRTWYEKLLLGKKEGKLIIGKNFHCNNKVDSNTIGLIQPCVFNIALENSIIKIGNNVGISGSTINASTSITIEDNVAIGSGCIITDTDSHPICYEDRMLNDNSKTNTGSIVIEEGAFIGARCIVMKSVTIGRHSVIGAGSIVTKSIPANCIACGNPAKIVKSLINT